MSFFLVGGCGHTLKSQPLSVFVSTQHSSAFSICQHKLHRAIWIWFIPERQPSQTKSWLPLTPSSVPACTLYTSTHAVYILFRLAKDPGLRQGSALTCSELLTRHLALGSATPVATLKLSRHCQLVNSLQTTPSSSLVST